MLQNLTESFISFLGEMAHMYLMNLLHYSTYMSLDVGGVSEAFSFSLFFKLP